MSTVRVWRVEHREYGVGPYIQEPFGSDLYKALNQHNGVDAMGSRPTPARDFGRRPEADEHFGMSCPDKLTSWFEGLWPLLDSAGYEVVEYLVPERHAQVSPRTGQVMFEIDAAERVTA